MNKSIVCASACLALVFTTTTSLAATYKTIYGFKGASANEPTNPVSGVVADATGQLFGTLQNGPGTFSGGVFKLTAGASAWTAKILHSFGAMPDGSYPASGLAKDAKGNLFGTTQFGGAGLGGGTVFEMKKTTAGYVYTQLKQFTEASMSQPIGAPVVVGNTVYGAASSGLGGTGGIYSLTYNATKGTWTYATIWQFPNTGASAPASDLTADAAGNLYGTTFAGGRYGYGSVYELVKPATATGQWQIKYLHYFNGLADGSHPIGGVTFLSDGRLVGTTSGGGAYGYGKVFLMTKGAAGYWSLQAIRVFTGQADGMTPASTLTVDKNDNIYGTTLGGGKTNAGCMPGLVYQNVPSSGCGVLFKLTKQTATSWNYKILHQFEGSNIYIPENSDGQTPVGRLIVNGNGVIFGTTYMGGAKNGGTVFRYAQ